MVNLNFRPLNNSNNNFHHVKCSQNSKNFILETDSSSNSSLGYFSEKSTRNCYRFDIQKHRPLVLQYIYILVL